MSATCLWYDDSDEDNLGPVCGAPATHSSCVLPYGHKGAGSPLNACAQHKCRCPPRPAEPKPAEATDPDECVECGDQIDWGDLEKTDPPMHHHCEIATLTARVAELEGALRLECSANHRFCDGGTLCLRHNIHRAALPAKEGG